jgi:hypothetical protein
MRLGFEDLWQVAGRSCDSTILSTNSTFGLLARLEPTDTVELGDAGRPRLAARGRVDGEHRAIEASFGRRAALAGRPACFREAQRERPPSG